MKKLIILALSLLFIFCVVACNNKNNETTKNSVVDDIDQSYYKVYTGLYDENLATITSQDMFSTNVDSVEKVYRGVEYPGNRQYLIDVKKAYKDRREKIQSFVNGLKNDTEIEDSDLKKLNENLIAEGEKLIESIDDKIAKLDNITGDDYNKQESDFVEYVDKTVNTDKNEANKFNDLLKEMDKKLGINRNTNEGK